MTASMVLGALTPLSFALFAALIFLWRRTSALQDALESAQSHGLAQIDALQRELQRRELQLAEYQEANARFRESEESMLRDVEYLRSEIEALQRDGVVLRRHTVFLDGMPRAGKTTLIRRLTNPAATAAQLDAWDSTLDRYHTFPVPLCWETGPAGQRILHTLEFYDVGGENPGHIGDNIDEYLKRRPPDHEPAVALVIWDSEAELPSVAGDHGSNMVYLSTGRLAAAYGTAKARQAISSFVFFLNKSDVVEDRMRREGLGEKVPRFFEQQQQTLMYEVYGKALAMYGKEPSIAIGSARTGFGVHDCLGAIVRHLGLAQHFEAVDQAAPVSPAKAVTQLVERRAKKG